MKMLIVGLLVLSAYTLFVTGVGHMFPSLVVTYNPPAPATGAKGG